jgi:hypothetical protein
MPALGPNDLDRSVTDHSGRSHPIGYWPGADGVLLAPIPPLPKGQLKGQLSIAAPASRNRAIIKIAPRIFVSLMEAETKYDRGVMLMWWGMYDVQN